MAYILRHAQSFEVYATTFKNSYDLPFYGVVFWEDEEKALHDAKDLIEAGWEIISISESKHKIINVKLNNDPKVKITYDNDGRVTKA